MKVLIATPTYEGMDYCFKEFLDAIKEMDKPFDSKILIIDNSKTKSYWRKLRKINNIKVIYDETDEKNNMLRLISSRNKILQYAIEKNYDYLLMLDSDVIVNPKLLTKLMDAKKDVISGLYFNKLNLEGNFVTVPIAYNFVTEEEFEKLKKENRLPKEAIKKEDLRRHLNNQEVQSKKILEVKIPSGGCVLLSKKAFTSGAKYGLEKEKIGDATSDDIYFFNRLREKEFKLYCDTSLICKHNIEKKYSEGKLKFN